MATSALTLSIYSREAGAQLKATLRMRQFVILSLALPLLFYSVFAVGFGHADRQAAQWLLATNLVLAAIGPAMFGFGASLAAEREAGLIEVKRISPMPFGAYLYARFVAATAVVAASAVAMIAIALAIGVSMTAWRWFALFAVVLFSVAPFGLIGLNLGLRLSSQAANAVGNLLFLIFATFGLWFPINVMPAALAPAAWLLPSFHLGQLQLLIVGMGDPTKALAHMAALAAMTSLAAFGAWSGWRRYDI
jgi:ABC-2 type transport system permease protein